MFPKSLLQKSKKSIFKAFQPSSVSWSFSLSQRKAISAQLMIINVYKTPLTNVNKSSNTHEVIGREMGSSESKEGQGSDQREESVESSDTALKAACAALIWGLTGAGQSESGSEVTSKLMKAPGRKGELIARELFEKDPKAYFRGLHGNGN